MQYGKAFELDLIEALRDKYSWFITTDAYLDEEKKIDFTVAGWQGVLTPTLIDFQVTMQLANGIKMKNFLRKAWSDANKHVKVYGVIETPAEVMVVAQAIHHALMCDLTGWWVKPGQQFGLYVSGSGKGDFFDIATQANVLTKIHRALTSTSNRKRGRVIDVRENRMTIISGGKKYLAFKSDVVGGNGYSALNAKKKIVVGSFVTMLPVGLAASSVKISKETKHRRTNATEAP